VARPTAAVAETTAWQEFPTLWRHLLDEVWTCLRAGGVNRGRPNVMLYWDDTPQVGVELRGNWPLTGRVVASAPPAGGDDRASRAVSGGGGASSARDWCVAQGHGPACPQWEIYGPPQRRSRPGVDRGLLPVGVTAQVRLLVRPL